MHHRAPVFASDSLMGGGEHEVYSVTVMFRTSLFPKNRARLRASTPNPRAFFECLAASFRESLAELPWRLPSLDECLAVQEATPGGDSQTT